MSVRVAVLALGLAACSGDDPLAEPPPFAVGAPGDTAVVAFGSDTELVESARELVTVFAGGEVDVETRDGAVLIRPRGVESGWLDLASSRTFRRALAAVDANAPATLFVDLQLAVDVGLERIARVDPRLAEIARRLGIASFESVIATVRRDGDGGLEIEGAIQLGDASAGIASVWADGHGSPSLLGAAVPGESVRAEFAVDADRARALIDAIGGDASSVGALLENAALRRVQAMLTELTSGLGGRYSFAIVDGRMRLGAEVTNADDLADALDSLGRPRDGEVWQLPGGYVAHLAGARLLVLPEGEPVPEPGGEPLVAVLVVDLWSGGPRPTRIELRRVDPLRFRFTARR